MLAFLFKFHPNSYKAPLAALPTDLPKDGETLEHTCSRQFQVRANRTAGRLYVPHDVLTRLKRYEAGDLLRFTLTQKMPNPIPGQERKAHRDNILMVEGRVKNGLFVATQLQVGAQTLFPSKERVAHVFERLAAYSSYLRCVETPDDPIKFLKADPRFSKAFGAYFEPVTEAQTRAALVFRNAHSMRSEL